jgi:hypothetical protein
MIRIIILAFVLMLVWATVTYAAPLLPDPDDVAFSNPTRINNPYFSLPVGRQLIYEGETNEGTQRIVMEATNETKKILGIKTLAVRNRVYVDGKLMEDAIHYLAQDNEGNVWHFGKAAKNDRPEEGSWLAGKEDARAAIWLPATTAPVGAEYYQEYSKGVAEDQGKIMSTTTTVTLGIGSFSNCLKTKDFTALEPEAVEYKFYCKQVAALALKEETRGNARFELIEIDGDGALNKDDDEEIGKSSTRVSPEAHITALQEQLIKLLIELLATLKR